MQNGYIERLNRLFREDVLDAYLFEELEDIRIHADQWMDKYNSFYPHSSLQGLSPPEFLKRA